MPTLEQLGVAVYVYSLGEDFPLESGLIYGGQDMTDEEIWEHAMEKLGPDTILVKIIR